MMGLTFFSSNFPVGIFPLERRTRPSDCRKGTDGPLSYRNNYICIFTVVWVCAWFWRQRKGCVRGGFPFVTMKYCKLSLGPICQTSHLRGQSTQANISILFCQQSDRLSALNAVSCLHLRAEISCAVAGPEVAAVENYRCLFSILKRESPGICS